tara:strand:- start:180 stop:317 length:138 start_codon:yes stop_codon:yes gene_type:complete
MGSTRDTSSMARMHSKMASLMADEGEVLGRLRSGSLFLEDVVDWF